jgi:hypothetical protein
METVIFKIIAFIIIRCVYHILNANSKMIFAKQESAKIQLSDNAISEGTFTAIVLMIKIVNNALDAFSFLW